MAKLVTSSKPISGATGFSYDSYLNSKISTFYKFGTPTITSTEFGLVFNALNDIVFTGTGFVGNPVAGFTAGTITSITHRVAGNQEIKITGLSLGAKEYFDFVQANPNRPMLALALVNNDSMSGTDYDDRLFGLSGNDAIRSGMGRDLLDGGDGNDTLAGGAGADKILGGLGSDTVDYSKSTQFVRVDLALQNSAQTGIGHQSGDTLQGIENVIGSKAGSDILSGDINRNTLKGLGGNDTLKGRGGGDVLEGGAGKDDLNGGLGSDTASYTTSTSRVTVDLRKTAAQSGGHAQGDTLSSIENIVGSAFADKLTGSAKANLIRGGKGADIMNGLGGTDTVSYAGSSKAVTVDLRKTTAQSGGHASGDKIDNFENLIGSSHADRLHGDAASNVLEGGNGADALIGAGGDDTASYASSSVAVWVALGQTDINLFTGDAIGDSFDSIENLSGSKHADNLFGSLQANVISGADGNDRLFGGRGNDTLSGGSGDDVFDSFYFGLNTSTHDGKDTITDFTAGAASGDKLRLGLDNIPNTFAAVMSKAVQVGNNTVIAFDAKNSITLINVQLGQLTPDDIEFFGLN